MWEAKASLRDTRELKEICCYSRPVCRAGRRAENYSSDRLVALVCPPTALSSSDFIFILVLTAARRVDRHGPLVAPYSAVGVWSLEFVVYLSVPWNESKIDIRFTGPLHCNNGNCYNRRSLSFSCTVCCMCVCMRWRVTAAAIGNVLIVFVVAMSVSKAGFNLGIRAKPTKQSAMSATAFKQLTFS